MILLLSPAKTLIKSPPKRKIAVSEPVFLDQANYLVSKLQKYDITALRELFSVSLDLAQQNHQRFSLWNNDFTQWPYSPSLLTFKGEVFRGLEAWTLSDEDLVFSQSHLRILSGLFGVLRPFDNIQAYRLEMGTALNNKKGNSLYDFWRKALTNYFIELIDKNQSQVIINLASKEYSKAIDFKLIKANIIELSFKDFHNGDYKFITVYGKYARGLMTRFIIQNRITDPEKMKAFDLGGYVYNERLSKDNHLTFTRG